MFHDEFMKKFSDDMKPYKIMMSEHRCAMLEVETKFKVLSEEFSLRYHYNPIENIQTRLKSMESIAQKVKKKGINNSVDEIQENIRDIAGVRVTCSFIQDIYKLKKCLCEQDDIIIIHEKDYIDNPKENGYRSLHLIIEIPIFLQFEKKYIKVEVQFRTIAMDFWASLEHKVRYKKNISKQLEEEFKNELKVCAEISALLDVKMENIKNHLYESR